MIRDVYTYFESPGSPQFPQATILEVWRANWEQFGWSVHVMSRTDAEAHPKYEHHLLQVCDIPTVNDRAYEVMCFVRWLAAEEVGARLVVDYDVLTSIPPEIMSIALAGVAIDNEVVALDATRIPCAVLVPATDPGAMVDMIFDRRALEAGRVLVSDHPHVSDMTVFRAVHAGPNVRLCDLWPAETPLRHFQTDVAGGSVDAKLKCMEEYAAALSARI